jgi:hypothetical protein
LKNKEVQYLSEVERPQRKRGVTPVKKSNVIVEKPTIVRYGLKDNRADVKSSNVLDTRLSPTASSGDRTDYNPYTSQVAPNRKWTDTKPQNRSEIPHVKRSVTPKKNYFSR